MKRFNLLTILLLSALVVSGCSDFLKPKSNTEYVPKDATSLNEILLGEGYMLMTGGAKTGVFTSVLDDDVTVGEYKEEIETPEAYKALKAAHTWDPKMFVVFGEAGFGDNRVNIWLSYYKYILGANAALDYIDEAEGKAELKALVKAQALALRALYHFELVNYFALPYNISPDSPGVPIKLNSALAEETPKKASVKEVYESVVSDLKESESIYTSLPEEMQYRNDFRTNLPMVRLLLSRVYLYMEKWNECSDYANKVISDSRFSLLNLNTVPTDLRPRFNFISVDNPEVIWLYTRAQDVFDFSTYKWKSPNDSFTNHIFMASEGLVKSFGEDDLRKQFYLVLDEFSGDPSDYTAFSKVGIHNMGGWLTTDNAFGKAFRVAEAYLNFAEAQAQLAIAGDAAKLKSAVEAINLIRKNRYKAGSEYEISATNASDLLKEVREERRRELCFEGHRWFDLRRYGMPQITHVWHDDAEQTSTVTLTEKDARYVLPIPETTKELNPNLSKQ